jgi:sigma-B regulation protein RsbU (phosphoserine phosphatase)
MLVDGESYQANQEKGRHMAAHQGSLLLVDDDDSIRSSLKQYLAGKGFAVTDVSDGTEALIRLAEGGHDLVLLDVLMDKLSGLEVLQRVRQTCEPTVLPIIMATALDEGHDVVEALRLGANDYVTKPFDFPVVLARVRTQLALKRSVERIVRLEESLAEQNAQLHEANRRMKRDLETAARVQAALLPHDVPRLAAVDVAWQYRPCTELAGDLLNVVALPDHRVALYVLDVSSHGAAAALLAVMVNRVLALYQRDGLGGDPATALSRIIAHLHQEFPRDPDTGQYFTLQYGILDSDSNAFRFVSAGHPGPAYLSRDLTARDLKVPGVPIGWLDREEASHVVYTERVVPLNVGDRLFLYSDGITDAFDADQKPFGVDRFLDTINRTRDLPLKDSVTTILQTVEQWSSPGVPHDDISILAVERTASF